MSAPDRGSDAAFREAVAASVARARAEGRTRWIARSVAVPATDPIDVFAGVGLADRFLWQRVDAGTSVVAWGVADEIESGGVDRFRDVREWQRSVRGRLDVVGVRRAGTAPTFFGGFAFESESRGHDDWKRFPAARFLLPEAIVERTAAGDGRLLAIARVEPGATVEATLAALSTRVETFERVAAGPPKRLAPCASPSALDGTWPEGPAYRVRADRPHAVFRAQVARALDAFRSGDLSKVVLARSLGVLCDGRLDVPAFLGRLRGLYPSCTLIAMGRGEDTFLAATPEALVRVAGDEVETAALAGSAPRGRTPEEDATLGDALLGDAKERSEHAYVVEAIREVLEGACESVVAPPSPSLRRLFGIQHLETPIRARRAADPERAARGSALALVEALHPTPAVGGVPARAARAWIREHEGLDRGWYAAPIGWLDVEDGGDFRVALRSGLIRNGLTGEDGAEASRARLFAGAGLVEGSDPEQELGETRIKLRALLAPLTEI